MAARLRNWDRGIVGSELIKLGLFPRKSVSGALPLSKPTSIETGTFDGTKMAVTEVYRRIEDRFGSFFDVANLESSIPQNIKFAAKQQLYTFQPAGSDKFSPHLNIIPPSDQVSLFNIFDSMRLLDTATLLARIIPGDILKFTHGDPTSNTIAGIEARNKILRGEGRDIYTEPNIGDRADWYTDAVFAQQQFTGPNPTTIERASTEWITQFARAAAAQGNNAVSRLLSRGLSDNSLFVQDCSYFRNALGLPPQAVLASDNNGRFACASVTLYQLGTDGKLHPLAIVLDYKGSIDASIVLFNKRLTPGDSSAGEASDWPWRYAKTCVQVSDWMRHELTVHLVNTHFVEEVTIVATHRSFPVDHVVFRLLEPHWLKTLSLNAAARSTLVPQIINQIVGVTDDQVYTYTRDAYARFEWEKRYVPNDLKARGFPEEELATPKFHNYTYARNMILMWRVLRTFVSSVLSTAYTADAEVANDAAVKDWCNEMRSASGGQMPSFPMITTLDGLTDAVTMCIHIASPQHTAVNYLQEYYQSFVIHKPSALFSPLPPTLAALQAYNEQDLIKALPVKNPREWLLASHLPHLLSFRVAEDQNLLNYAVSIAELAAQKGETEVADAGTKLFNDLVQLTAVFERNSKEMDDQTFPYEVMNPEATASSILI